MSSSIPIVAVVGATGQQGGSVIRALLKSGNYRIRGLTRDVNSSSSKALTVQGVEMVSADMNDRKSLENAFHGAEIVFAVTNFWDPANIAAYVKDDAKSDLHQGKNMADAAKAVGVKRYVWSTLPPSLEISGGKCDVPHFDNPAQVDKHIQSIGLDAVFYVPGLYMNNFVHYYPPLKGADGVLEFWQPVRPDAAVPAVDIDDTGAIVVYLLNHWDAWRGKHFNAAPRYITFQDIVDSYTHVHGTKTRYVYISQATFKKYTQQGLPPKVQDEVLRMHDLFNQFGYFGGALLAEQPKDRSFEYTTIDKYWQKQGKLSADK